MREASQVVLAAFVASQTTSRPLVEEMCKQMAAERLASIDVCMDAYDTRTRNGLQRLLGELPEGVHSDVLTKVEASAATAQRRRMSWTSGEEEEREESDIPIAATSTRPGTSIIADAGTEDPEHPAASPGSGSLRLQRQIVRISDACSAQGLLARARQAGDHDTIMRLTELCSPLCNHEWMWSISKHKGRTMSSRDYAAAMRIRLGAGGPDQEAICANCGIAVLGPSGSHGLLCARGPCNRGHNEIRDEVFAFASAIDATAELEPLGLVASRPALRPADVLTGVPDPSGRLAALDVGVIAPHAQGSGNDCVETMVARKQQRADGFRDELEQGGIEYRVLAISCYGRLHPEFDRILSSMAKAHARRKGSEAAVELRKVKTKIAVAIWRRAARMVQACTPLAADEEDIDEEEPIVAEVAARRGHPGTVTLPDL